MANGNRPALHIPPAREQTAFSVPRVEVRAGGVIFLERSGIEQAVDLFPNRQFSPRMLPRRGLKVRPRPHVRAAGPGWRPGSPPAACQSSGLQTSFRPSPFVSGFLSSTSAERLSALHHYWPPALWHVGVAALFDKPFDHRLGGAARRVRQDRKRGTRDTPVHVADAPDLPEAPRQPRRQSHPDG